MRSSVPPWTSLAGIVFDFDGVILESVDIKTEAFLELFADRPEHREAIRRHHLENVGHSRYRKFEWIFRELFAEPLSEAASLALGERYSSLVLDQVLRCPFVPGATALLDRLGERLPTFVASGTPEEELLLIVEQRGLSGTFEEVRGTPELKPEILRGFLRRLGCAPRELLMVGDGATDLAAAREAGTEFVGRRIPGKSSPFDGEGVVVVDDLHELGRLLDLG